MYYSEQSAIINISRDMSYSFKSQVDIIRVVYRQKSPVKIWIIKQSPKRDPKFHMDEILAGVGSFTTELSKIFSKGLWFLKGIIILSKLPTLSCPDLSRNRAPSIKLVRKILE